MASVRQNKFKAILGFAVIAGTIVIAFQNCSQIDEKAQFPSEENLAANAPFPYDVDLDTYAYMSCNSRADLKNDGPYKDTYFSARMGAIRSGSGVFLSQSFRDFADANKLNTNKMEEILDDNQFSRDARLQISLRSVANLRGNALGVGSYPSRVNTIWSSLSVAPLSSNLVDTDSSNKIKISSGGMLIGSVLVGHLSESSIQDSLKQTGIMTVGFQGAFYTSAADREHKIMGPIDVYKVNINGVFGKGYDPEFQLPTFNGSYVNHGLKVMTSVNERTVLDGTLSSTASFTCRSQAQYRIVPLADTTAAGCDPNATNAGLSGDDLKAFEAANAMLIQSLPNGSSKWKIDQAHRCIIDVNSQCYDTSLRQIQWGTTSTDVCDGSNPKQCPQYMSICWK